RDARLAEAVVARAAPGARAGMLGDVAHLALAQLLRALLHPAVWRFVPLPRARGGSADEESRARRAPGRVVARYLAAAAASHPLVVAERRRNALALRERLAGEVAGGIGLPDAGSLRAGVALRLPVLFERADDARAVRCALAEQRIVKGPNDWDDYGRASAAAAAIADRLVTLPTHPGSEHAARRAIAVIAQRLGA
ncbi:hypothetical protein K2Z84_14570, partial [Candidatus Binatia bacterium]|nr:hypothetical protein [Candidatus Binatia bacterium]